MHNMTATSLRLLAVLVLSVGGTCLGEALLAKGLKHDGASGWLALVRAVALDRHFLAGITLTVVCFGLYLLTLRWGDLSLVLPVTALSYPLGAALGKFYLAEDVSPTRWLGVVIITVGVLVILADCRAAGVP
jgi:drug/metabolite transporter (DMT)-like permease